MEFEEIRNIIFAGVFLFVTITAIFVFILLFYQKKRFQHYNHVLSLEKKFAEEILNAKIEIQESTLNYVSEEIHDNTGQLLSLVKIQLAIIQEKATYDAEMVDNAKSTVTQVIRDLRELARGMNSSRIQNFEIVETISAEVERINNSQILKARLEVEGIPKPISASKKLILFRVIQESVQNVIKHSKASELVIHFDYREEQINILISDNGVGFETTEAKGKGGLGLSNIVNRISILNGSVSFLSKPGEGSSVKISISYS